MHRGPTRQSDLRLKDAPPGTVSHHTTWLAKAAHIMNLRLTRSAGRSVPSRPLGHLSAHQWYMPKNERSSSQEEHSMPVTRQDTPSNNLILGKISRETSGSPPRAGGPWSHISPYACRNSRRSACAALARAVSARLHPSRPHKCEKHYSSQAPPAAAITTSGSTRARSSRMAS